jgi:hypothetical protein
MTSGDIGTTCLILPDDALSVVPEVRFIFHAYRSGLMLYKT